MWLPPSCLSLETKSSSMTCLLWDVTWISLKNILPTQKNFSKPQILPAARGAIINVQTKQTTVSSKISGIISLKPSDMGYSLYPILCISPRYCTRGDELPVNMHKLLGNSLESIGQFYPRQQLYKAVISFSKSLFMSILILRDNPILLHTLSPSNLQSIFLNLFTIWTQAKWSF